MHKREIFFVEDRGHIVLFAPIKGLIMEVSGDEKEKVTLLMMRPNFVFEDLVGIFPEINSSCLIYDNKKLISKKTEDFGFCPNSVVLFPTFDCGLRCVYCYASAGDCKVDMDWPIAEAVIHFIIENAKR